MKKIFLLIIIVVLSINISFATIFQTSLNLDYCHDTNVFSSPLPSYDTSRAAWLEWRADNPFQQINSLGASINMDLFFQDSARTGLSSMLNIHFPLTATTITPTAESEEGFKGEWHYQYTDTIESQALSIFGSIGPIFKASFDFCDIGIALRFSMGTYNIKNQDFIIGLQAEPFANFFFSNTIYITSKFTYDAHFLRFIKSKNEIYDKHYMMLSLVPSIGIGFRFN